jgi:hypothetical protein
MRTRAEFRSPNAHACVQLTDEMLVELMAAAAPKSILLMEDVDAAFHQRVRFCYGSPDAVVAYVKVSTFHVW